MSELAGLAEAEAQQRLARHGANALAAPPAPSWLSRVLAQLKSPLVYLLLLALLFDLASHVYRGATGVPFEALLIAVVVILNTALAVLQEHRAEAALAALRALGAPQARVRRDGRWQSRPSEELVPGDCVRVEAGERVPADGRLALSHGLALDESLLTGESLPVERGEGEVVLSGSLAVRGAGVFEVTATGTASQMGRIAAQLGGLAVGATPLERRLDRLGKLVARWVVGIATLGIAAGVAAEGVAQLGKLLLFGVALAVSAVPEGLPVVVALTLALGVQRMAKRHALVRRLAAVEALGSVTVIATDKTGTLTENRMTVQALDAGDPHEALLAAVLANEAEIEGEAGDPIDRALLNYARAQGVDPALARAARPVCSLDAFDSAARCMSVTVEQAGERVRYWKGASEVLLARAALDTGERARWTARAAASAERGMRVLALAVGDEAGRDGLRFLGLASIWDPPRSEVPAAIAAVQRAGVRVVMLTGDHPGTARFVARSLGMAGAESEVLTGAQLEGLDTAALRETVRRCQVFARVGPEHKLALVEALRAAGEIVAVTGDGVNDAPALRRADVGVAMGRRGSDVAREVADLVLLDDNFASIVAAIREGREIYANIEKFVRFLFSTNAGELLLVLAGTLGAYALGLRDASGALLLPLTAAQILWVNFITDGPAALALALDRNPDVMAVPPRPPDQPLLDGPSLRFVLLAGGAKAVLAGALLLGLPALGISLEATRTAVFLHTALGQLVFAYPSRRFAGRPLPNPILHVTLALAAAAQLSALLVPGLRDALGVVPLDGVGWLAVAGSVALSWAAAEATRSWVCRSKAPAGTSDATSSRSGGR